METKQGKKQAKLRSLGLGLAEEEVLEMLELWSNDDEPVGPSRQPRTGSSKRAEERGVGTVGFKGLGSVSKVDLVADFRNRIRTRAGASSSSAAVVESKNEMPEGVKLLGAGSSEPVFEEQEDGSHALQLPEGAFLKLELSASPWVLHEDGKLHAYTIVLAIRVDALRSTPTPLFNGGAPVPSGEKVESVQLYKNGGVGALNDMGTQEAAVHAERWSWIVVTRKPGELKTYVNARLCADIRLESAAKRDEKGRTATQQLATDAADAAKDDGRSPAAKDRKPLQATEKFVLDPQFLALFADGDGRADKDQPPRGLAIKYLRVTSAVWTPSEVAEELHKIRSADEDAELLAKAEHSRALHLSLQPLYAKPPPMWRHPTFAAECIDPFIAGVRLPA